MQIKMTYKEMRSLKSVLRGLDENVLGELKKFKNTNGVKVTLNTSGIVIDIAPEYFEDVMNVYNKYLGILVAQTKALYKTCENYFEEVTEVTTKYFKSLPEDTTSEEKPSEEKTDEVNIWGES